MTNQLDRDRLLRDLDATLADLRVGRWPSRAATYWRLRGFEQAVLVLRAGIVDGEYDVDPAARYRLTERGEQVAGRWPGTEPNRGAR